MPVEREFKYVLDHRNNLEQKLIDQGTLGVVIKQGYLSKGGRIRSKTYPVDHSLEGTTQYIFTYKHKLSRQPGCLEIEQDITESDFLLAWSEADHVINKIRYVVECTNSFVWEIDFFRDADDKTFFALAECEVHEGQDRPKHLHEFVKNNLLLAVEESDNRFQNRKLSDVKKTTKLFKEAVSGKA
jgi:hypothetical protein